MLLNFCNIASSTTIANAEGFQVTSQKMVMGCIEVDQNTPCGCQKSISAMFKLWLRVLS